MQWEPKCQHGSNFSVAFWHVLMFFPRTVLCNFSQALRRKLKTCRSFQVQSRRLYCWGAQAPFLTQLDVSLWWGNSLKTFLVKSKRLKSSLVLNRSFLLSSLQRTPGPCRILPYIFEACFTMKSKNKFQNKWKPELSYSNQVSDASFSSLKLVTWNTSFFFFPHRWFEWRIWQNRWSMLPILWNKCSFSLESIAGMIHPHPAAKLPVTRCLFSCATIPGETPN